MRVQRNGFLFMIVVDGSIDQHARGIDKQGLLNTYKKAFWSISWDLIPVTMLTHNNTKQTTGCYG